MEQQINKALELAKNLGATYADIRLEEVKTQGLFVKNENLERVQNNIEIGFGVRVIKNGSWGFASSNKVTELEFVKVVKQAISIAEVSARVSKSNVKLASVPVVKDYVKSPAKIDPFTVSLKEKIDLLTETSSRLNINQAVFLRNSTLSFRKLNNIFASTEGSYIEQERIETGCGITAVAKGNNDVQSRSFPNAFGGDYSTFGWEFVLECDLLNNAKLCAEEAIALSQAKLCPSGTKDIIVMGNQMAL